MPKNRKSYLMNSVYHKALLIMLLLPRFANAMGGISADVDFVLRCDGREFEVQHVFGSPVIDTSDDSVGRDSGYVWDFSKATFSDLMMPLSFSSKGDSIIYATTDRLRLTFAADSASLLLLSKESPFTRIDYSPAVAVRYIDASYSECKSEYEASGRVFQSNYIYVKGVSKTEMTSNGTLIRCEGDTIPDACLELRTVNEKIFISNAPCDSSYLAVLPDSAFSIEESRIYTWRKQSDMTPLARTVNTHAYSFDGSAPMKSTNSFLLFALEEEIPAVQSMRKPNTADKDSNGASADYNGNSLSIRGVYGDNVSLLVTDILGRIYYEAKGLDASSGVVSVPITLNNGAYVVAVFNDDGVTSIKFVVE